MKYGQIDYVEKKVSRIFFGTAIGSIERGKTCFDLLDNILSLGINAFDLARVYMGSEGVIGKWMEKRECRDKIVLLSKCAHPNIFGKKRVNEAEIRKDFKKSCECLRTEYIDIYLLHRDNEEIEVGEIVEILNEMHEEGKIGAFGGSNWTCRRIEEANEYAYKKNLIPFTVSSPNFGLAEQIRDPWGGGCITVTGKENTNSKIWYEENQMPLVAYSSLARGLFSGKVKSNEWEKSTKILDGPGIKGYVSEENHERLRRAEILSEEKKCTVAQIALSYIFSQKLNAYAVVSTRNSERMKSNIKSLDIQLNENECKWLNLEIDKRSL